MSALQPAASVSAPTTRLIRGPFNVGAGEPLLPKGCVATIGNFDGLHRGHQAVMEQLKSVAHDVKLPSAVVLFEPQPSEFLCPDQAPPRIMGLREKFQGLRAVGMDHVLVLRFFAALSAMGAESFARRILIHGLGARHLVVGDDFRFGKDRSGDFHLLRRMGEAHGFAVERMRTFDLDGERVSSTRVRAALAAGEYDEARRLLSRPFRIHGRVIHGGKLGREIGFPTINIPMHRHRSPVSGIFAARVYGEGLDERGHPGVGYVGRRPTVRGLNECLEVHLFNYSGHLYGLRLGVELQRHLREDRHFDSIQAMTAQIQRDADAARHYFENQHE